MRIDHFYGRTVRSLGLSEDEFIAANSRPSHAWHECLRRLAVRHGITHRIILYTEGPRRRTVERDGLEWVLIPATWGRAYAHLPLRPIMRHPEYQFSLDFRADLRRDPPDLFVFYGNLPTPFARALATDLVGREVPYVATVHSRVEDLLPRAGAPRWGPGALLARLRAGEAPFLFRHAAAVLVLTPEDRDMAVAHGLAVADRVQALPSAIHAQYFHPGDAGGKGPFPQLCFVGRLEHAKGIESAVNCLAEVRRRFPKARLHAAGSFTNDRERRSLEELLRRDGLADRFHLHGWLGPEELGNLYRASHLLLFPSLKEGLPRVVLESMGCGTPVAAVAGTGGHDTVIRHGENGIRTTREQYALEVVRWLADRGAMEAMSRSAAADIERDYSLETMYRRVERLYLALLDSARAGSGPEARPGG
jgi:glycosyltransferase involved in cell wall biosynthesis